MSDEEVLTLVGSGLRSGSLKPHEARVIENVLSMETQTAREIMTPRPVVFTLAAQATVREAAGDENLTKHSRISVYDADPEDLVGVVHTIDILRAVAHDRFDVRMDAIMRPIHFAIDTTALDELLRTFLERRAHLAAVIDEFGGFAGIVTLEDVLEELLGHEIVDESDQETDLRAYAHRAPRRDVAPEGTDSVGLVEGYLVGCEAAVDDRFVRGPRGVADSGPCVAPRPSAESRRRPKSAAL